MKRKFIISSLLVVGILVISIGTVNASTLEVTNGVKIEKSNEEKVESLDVRGPENVEATSDIQGTAQDVVQEEEQAQEATTGTLNLKAYYIPLDLKYESPIFFNKQSGAWTEAGDKLEIEATMTLELFNTDTEDWKPAEVSASLKPGRYRVTAGEGYGNPVTQSKEFIIKEGKTTTVEMEYTNFEVPTSFTVEAASEGLDIEGLTYIISADDATYGTKELRRGTVVDGKITTTLENEGKYKISFSNGTETTQPVPFKILPDSNGTYTNNIRIYEFGKSPVTDATEGETPNNQDQYQTTPNTQPSPGKGAPQTSMMGQDFTPIFGTILLVGSGAGIYFKRNRR